MRVGAERGIEKRARVLEVKEGLCEVSVGS